MNQTTMRQQVVKSLMKIDNKNTFFLTSDVGYGVLEPLQKKMKNRFINVGIAEQSMVSIASGLALSGKRVFTYTMCAFYLRTIEQIKDDLCYQDVPVVLIGVGSQFDYQHLGTTHFALEDDKIIASLLNIDVVTPKNIKELDKELRKKRTRPAYIRVGGWLENDDVELDYEKLVKYPKVGGSKDYFKELYGKRDSGNK